ncbi:hypothetical protein O5D80_006372 [Batrachochytrium dendrobatidis]|nr:hypothetical protein O5D80_006372 [Batrachochytrium dendrobatidis]
MNKIAWVYSVLAFAGLVSSLAISIPNDNHLEARSIESSALQEGSAGSHDTTLERRSPKNSNPVQVVKVQSPGLMSLVKSAVVNSVVNRIVGTRVVN